MKTKCFLSMILVFMASVKAYGGPVVTVEERATMNTGSCFQLFLPGDAIANGASEELILLAKLKAVNEAISQCGGIQVDRISDWDIQSSAKCLLGGGVYSYAPIKFDQRTQTVVASAQFECLEIDPSLAHLL